MLKLLKKFYLFLNPNHRFKILELTFYSIINSILEFFSIISIIPIIYSLFKKSENLSLNFFDKILLNFGFNEKNLILYYIYIFVLFNIFKILFVLFYNYRKFEFLVNFQSNIKDKIFKSYIWLKYNDLIKYKGSKIISNVNKSSMLSDNILKSVIEIINDLFLILIFLVAIIFLSKLEYIFYGIFLFILVFFIGLIFKNKIKFIGDKLNTLINDYGEYILACIKNIKIIVLKNKQNFFSENAHKLNFQTSKNLAIFNFLQSINRPIFEFIFIIIISLILIFSLKYYEYYEIIIFLTILVASFSRIGPVLIRMLSNHQALVFSKAQVDELLYDISKVDELENTVIETEKLGFLESIEVKNLSFKYKDANEYLFKNLNFTIHEGDIVKISGVTGVGKSTLGEILIGLNDNYEGNIFVDGVELKTINNKWANNVNYIPQEPYLFNDTIINNIFFGSNKSKIDKKKFNELVEICEISKTIDKFENRENTFVGERGVRLSGGENQRINIARGLVDQSDILFMDESTNALNKEVERSLFKNILSLKKFKVIFVITHGNNLDEFFTKTIEIK